MSNSQNSKRPPNSGKGLKVFSSLSLQILLKKGGKYMNGTVRNTELFVLANHLQICPS